MNQPLTFTLGSFNLSSGTPEDLKNATVAGLQANFEGNNVLFGKIDGAAPTDGTTLYFTDGAFTYLEGSTYRPVKLRVGTATAQITFVANPTGTNKTQTLQDKDGTIALLSDVTTPRPTKILTFASKTIDWSVSDTFFYQMDASTVMPTFANSLPGQTIKLLVYTPTSGKTITFQASINWTSGGGQPVQSTPGTDLWVFSNVAGQLFGLHYGAFS